MALDKTWAIIGLIINIFLPCIGSIVNGFQMGQPMHWGLGILFTVIFWIGVWFAGIGAIGWILGIAHSIYLLLKETN